MPIGYFFLCDIKLFYSFDELFIEGRMGAMHGESYSVLES